ncbi:MAG: hypothetical protein R3F34_06955 [Planctomycetota bacterium]
MDEHGNDGSGDAPFGLVTRSSRRLLAWPRWGDPDSLRRLAAAVEPIARTDAAALVLRFDPELDGDHDAALDALVHAFAEHYGEEIDLEVVLEDHPIAPSDLARIGAAVHGLLDLGDRDAAQLAPFGHAPLADANAVAAWLDALLLGADLDPLVREALDSLDDARALWIGGPGHGAAGRVTTELGGTARLAVVGPTREARRARAELFASPGSENVDWYDLAPSDALAFWDDPLELLVIDGSVGALAARRAFDGWRQHLLPGAYVVLLGASGTGTRWLEEEGFRLRSESGGSALLVAPLPAARAADGR